MGNKSYEVKCENFNTKDLNSIRIKTKNYRVHIVKGNEEKIVVHYVKNQFRSMNITRRGNSLHLEEKMTVTFYGLFRFMELMEENELLIEIPGLTRELCYEVNTGVTGVIVEGIEAKRVNIRSSTGEISIRNVEIAEKLDGFSSAGKISCYMPGNEKDYRIDCRVDRKDRVQPCFNDNPAADKSIILHSGMYLPELNFIA